MNAIVRNILIIIGVFIAINLVLWLAQELYYWDDGIKIRELENELESIKISISKLDASVDDLTRTIESRKEILEKLKMSGQIELYNRGVAPYNDLVAKLNIVVSDYKQQIESRNDLVSRLNLMIKNSGTRWYLIPIPGRSKNTVHAR